MLPKVSVEQRTGAGIVLELTRLGGVFLFPYELPLQSIFSFNVDMEGNQIKVNGEVCGRLRASSINGLEKICPRLQYLVIARFQNENIPFVISDANSHNTEAYNVICQDGEGNVFVLSASDLTPIGLKALIPPTFKTDKSFQIMFLLNPSSPYVEATAITKNLLQSTQQDGQTSNVLFVKISEEHLQKVVSYCIENGKIKIPSVDEVALITMDKTFNMAKADSSDSALITAQKLAVNGTQKREYMRSPMRLRVVYENSRGVLITAFTKDVSTGGLGLVTETSLPVDAEYSFKLFLPDDTTYITCKGKVVWSFCKGAQCFSGVSFTEISGEERALLARHVFIALRSVKQQ